MQNTHENKTDCVFDLTIPYDRSFDQVLHASSHARLEWLPLAEID